MTTPITLLLDQFDHLLTTPEAVEELNRAILTLAVQGKLVEQDPQDEPASELLKRVSGDKHESPDQSITENEDKFPKLPDGWALATISDLIAQNSVFVDGDWVESKDQDPEGEVRLIQLADVGDSEYRNRSNRFMTSQKASQLGCTSLEPGDILVARMPDPLGRACIFPGDKNVCVTVVDVCIIRPGTTDIFNKWLMYAINTPDFRIAINNKKSGTTRQRVGLR